MIPAYTPGELDNIIKAALQWKEMWPDELFYAGHISGREGVPAGEAATIKKKMKYIAGLNLDILEYRGFGNDNIEYFDLGSAALPFLQDGGFARYYKNEKRKLRLEKVALWSPIAISLIALIVAALTWLLPVQDDRAIEQLKTEVATLKQEQTELNRQLQQLQRR